VARGFVGHDHRSPLAEDTPPQDGWPTVVITGTQSAYVDQVADEDSQLVVPKEPIQAGTVNGLPWSLVAYVAPPDLLGEAVSEPAPCGEVFLGDAGAMGGGATCLTALAPGQGSVQVAGIDWGAGSVSAYFGVVARDVTRVQVSISGGKPVDVQLVAADAVTDATMFVLFVPNQAPGTLAAYSSDSDKPLYSQALCLTNAAVQRESTVGCQMQ